MRSGALLEARDGRPFAVALSDRVLAPLGMAGTELRERPSQGLHGPLADAVAFAREFLRPTLIGHDVYAAEATTVAFPGLKGRAAGCRARSIHSTGDSGSRSEMARRRTGPALATRRRRSATSAGPAPSSGSIRRSRSRSSVSPTASSTTGRWTHGRRSRMPSSIRNATTMLIRRRVQPRPMRMCGTTDRSRSLRCQPSQRSNASSWAPSFERKREGKKTRTDMSEKELEKYASKSDKKKG